VKKIYPILLVFILGVSISCKKNEEQLSLKDFLQGNWNYQKLITSSYQNDGKLIKELITPLTSNDYGYIFYDDGTCTYRFGGSPSMFSYQIISDTEFELNTGSVNLCKILSIDKTNIIFVTGGSKQTGNNYITYTHYLSR